MLKNRGRPVLTPWVPRPTQEETPDAPPAALIKSVEAQLLQSDLASSTRPPSRIPSPLPLQPTVLFPGKGKAVLFQITRIDDIAHPALGILDTLKEKREERKVLQRQEQAGEVQNEEGAVERVLRDGEEADVVGKYPRGMVRVRLSDGHAECDGIEYERVNGLGLEEVQLGCKVRLASTLRAVRVRRGAHRVCFGSQLLIHSVRVVRGILLLTPACVIVKGHAVQEFEEEAEATLEAALRARLACVSHVDLPTLDNPLTGGRYALKSSTAGQTRSRSGQ